MENSTILDVKYEFNVHIRENKNNDFNSDFSKNKKYELKCQRLL